MTRTRVATVLGVVAVLSVVATAAVATRDRRDPEPMLTVTGSGATFEVPDDGWRVEDPSVRIYYTDTRDRPVAVVRGPAVLDPGYCGTGSNRAFAGFTRQPLEAWTRSLGTAGPVDRGPVPLDDGTVAMLEQVDVEVDARGECAAREVAVAMVEAGDVRVVLVSDAGALSREDVETILRSLELA
jgi:hypothetical protein